MADTTIYALVGSLLFTLTVIPVLCAIALRGGVKERRNAAFEWIRDKYQRGLDWCLARTRLTIGASVALFVLSMLIAFSIGGEFMPKLVRVVSVLVRAIAFGGRRTIRQRRSREWQ